MTPAFGALKALSSTGESQSNYFSEQCPITTCLDNLHILLTHLCAAGQEKRIVSQGLCFLQSSSGSEQEAVSPQLALLLLQCFC